MKSVFKRVKPVKSSGLGEKSRLKHKDFKVHLTSSQSVNRRRLRRYLRSTR